MNVGSFFPEIYLQNAPESIYKVIKNNQDGVMFKDIHGLVVICAGEIHEGKKWLHVSFSRKSRIPTYKEMERVKRHFIGRDKKAIMILPEESNHINIMPYCLHLYHEVDSDRLPDFTGGTGSI